MTKFNKGVNVEKLSKVVDSIIEESKQYYVSLLGTEVCEIQQEEELVDITTSSVVERILNKEVVGKINSDEELTADDTSLSTSHTDVALLAEYLMIVSSDDEYTKAEPREVYETVKKLMVDKEIRNVSSLCHVTAYTLILDVARLLISGVEVDLGEEVTKHNEYIKNNKEAIMAQYDNVMSHIEVVYEDATKNIMSSEEFIMYINHNTESSNSTEEESPEDEVLDMSKVEFKPYYLEMVDKEILEGVTGTISENLGVKISKKEKKQLRKVLRKSVDKVYNFIQDGGRDLEDFLNDILADFIIDIEKKYNIVEPVKVKEEKPRVVSIEVDHNGLADFIDVTSSIVIDLPKVLSENVDVIYDVYYNEYRGHVSEFLKTINSDIKLSDVDLVARKIISSNITKYSTGWEGRLIESSVLTKLIEVSVDSDKINRGTKKDTVEALGEVLISGKSLSIAS